MIECDVAVIGGGVAGSTAAMCLAQGGLRVLLLDKGTFPRHKVCGEFLSPEGVEVLHRLGVWAQVTAHQPPPIRMVTLSAKRQEIHCPLPRPGWGLRRWTLDRLLWEHARTLGVTTWARCMVQRVTGDVGHGFQLTVQHPSEPVRQVLARVVLCAAGRHWRQPAAQNATTGSRSQQFLGLKVHVQNVPLNGSVELHTFRQGYCGLAEVDGGVTAVCCWGETDTWRHVGSTPDHFLAQCVQENPALQRRLRLAKRLDVPWTAVAYARRGTPAPLEDGMWKVGDCVAMIAPLTGDGMGMAMQAAEQAATLVLAAFRGHLSWAEASRTYERVWHREFSSRIRWGRRLEGVLRRPWSASLACMALGVMPSIMGALYGCTRDLRRSSTPEGEWRSRAAT